MKFLSKPTDSEGNTLATEKYVDNAISSTSGGGNSAYIEFLVKLALGDFPDGNLVIPDGITSIGTQAFIGTYGGYDGEPKFDTIKSIIMPNSVTSIGDYAFAAMCNLENVIFSNNLTNMGSYMFYKCRNISSITIPDGITSIPNGMFNECDNLTSITIPDSVTSIGDYAFYKCTSLASITIPNSVTSIGNGAFSYYIRSMTIIIPTSVTIIKDYAFYYSAAGDTKVLNIYYTGTEEQWEAITKGKYWNYFYNQNNPNNRYQMLPTNITYNYVLE